MCRFVRVTDVERNGLLHPPISNWPSGRALALSSWLRALRQSVLSYIPTHMVHNVKWQRTDSRRSTRPPRRWPITPPPLQLEPTLLSRAQSRGSPSIPSRCATPGRPDAGQAARISSKRWPIAASPATRRRGSACQRAGDRPRPPPRRRPQRSISPARRPADRRPPPLDSPGSAQSRGRSGGIIYHGELKGEERVYDNRLLVYLLGKIQHLLEPPPRPRRSSPIGSPGWRQSSRACPRRPP